MIRHLVEKSGGEVWAPICIIGAGAAGIAIAVELSRAGAPVCVLEAGERRFDREAQDLYESETSGVRHDGVHSMRFRVFGGSTTRWAGQALPFFDCDFARRPWIPHSGWPITRKELAPYYQRAAALMQIPAPLGEAGWLDDFASVPGFDPRVVHPSASIFSSKPDFVQLYGKELEDSRLVEVILGANVTGFTATSAKDGIASVEARGLDGSSVRVFANQFVLAAGGIETARILLAARAAGGDAIPGSDGDDIGRFFQDHPGFIVGPISGASPRLAEFFFPARINGLKHSTRLSAAPELQQRERIVHTASTVTFDLTQDPAVTAAKQFVQVLRGTEDRAALRPALRELARHPTAAVSAAYRRVVLKRPTLDPSSAPTLVVGCEQLPSRESRITLSDKRDALGIPRTRLTWHIDERELAACERFAAITASELDRLGLGYCDTGHFRLPRDEAALAEVVFDAGHHMGTTRMALEDGEGVVDARCRLIGRKNLYIGSCSVFPTGGVSNPTFTMLALCARIADDLVEAHREHA